jgi:hypothetical protein
MAKGKKSRNKSITMVDLRCRAAADDPLLLKYVETIAFDFDRPFRPLLLQALLQLPRLADRQGLVSTSDVKNLLAELAQELPAKSEWLISDALSSPKTLQFDRIDPIIARRGMERFHYLRSPRTDGRAYGLTTNSGRLVAFCVSSPVDVRGLHKLLAPNRDANGLARVISRVFAFKGAPRNLISYMLARVAQQEWRLGVTDFVTYVNPNMAFSGCSYRASGWRLLGVEAPVTYRYLDHRYITDRELAARFGGTQDEAYEQQLGCRFAVSVMALAPLWVFHTYLKMRRGKSQTHRGNPTGIAECALG